MDKLQVVYKRLDEIKPYENNPRLNDDAVEPVANSIKEFGFKVPIVVDKDGVIVAGHTRYKAAQKLGLQSVPCLVADDLSPEQIKAFRLADNKTGELADWDFNMLGEELGELDDFNMERFGFDIDDYLTPPEEAKEDEFDVDQAVKEPDPIKIQQGDIFQLGKHRLMCGDSTKQEDVSRLLGRDTVDLYITDPPYNVALGMGGSVDESRKKHLRADGLVIMNDKMEGSEFRSFLDAAFSCAKSVMNPGAAFYIWHAGNEGYNFQGALQDAGFTLRQTLIWNKNAMTLGRQDYQWKHEPCLYGWNDGTHHWYSDRKQTTVIDIDKPVKSTEHPTMKPVKLFGYLMENSSKPGQKVLDSFGGSGTTLIAAEELGRICYMMELDPHYCNVIIKRWKDLTGQKAIKVSE